MRKGKDNDNWTQLNDITNYVIGKDVSSKSKKRWLTAIIIVIMLIGLAVSTFFIGLVMQSAFNIGDFKEKHPEESIIVDMDKVPIYSSNESLRLSYFEEESKNQVFELLIKDFWWDAFFPTDIAKYDFTYYQTNSNDALDKSLVQTDGFADFDLKIKLKDSFIEFKIPVITFIINTNKFYEKFMKFNHFESSYSTHINGYNPPTATTTAERRYHGYLNHNYHYTRGTTLNNTTVYQTINDQINDFINDFSQEFSSETKIYPILSPFDLGDIDVKDPLTFIPYINLIHNRNSTYIGNDTIGGINEYVNLLNYTINTGTGNLNSFYISYVSNPNIINELIALNPTTSEEIINYFSINHIQYIPFSHNQTGLDSNDNLIAYSPRHILTFETADSSHVYFQYWELDFYFTNAQSIKNDIENIDATSFANIGVLTSYLSNKFWNNILLFLQFNPDYFRLIYPDASKPPIENWTNSTSSVNALQQYFITILGIQLAELTTIQYLDLNHDDLNLNLTSPIIPKDIKNIYFNIGPEELDVSVLPHVIPPPHGLSYFFSINWI